MIKRIKEHIKKQQKLKDEATCQEAWSVWLSEIIKSDRRLQEGSDLIAIFRDKHDAHRYLLNVQCWLKKQKKIENIDYVATLEREQRSDRDLFCTPIKAVLQDD